MDQFIRLGLTDMASFLAMEADSIWLPPVGSALKKQQVLAEITAGGKKAKISSPLTGSVSAVNRDVEESPTLAWRDPYRRGWLLMIQPNHPEEISQLYSGKSAKTWFTHEAKKLAILFTEWAPNPSQKEGPQEGCSIQRVIHDQWDKLTEILLSPGGPRDYAGKGVGRYEVNDVK
jgi:glycine cleavage system H protein